MRPSVFAERYGPLVIGAAGFGLFIWQGSGMFAHAKENEWNVPAIYSSIFDLSSIITAFVFSFFTFARTSETEFLHSMRKTVTYKRFMSYLVMAMYSSAFVVFASIPFMIAEPQPTSRSEAWYWLCALWVGLVAFSLAATARSMRQFIAMAMVEKDG